MTDQWVVNDQEASAPRTRRPASTTPLRTARLLTEMLDGGRVAEFRLHGVEEGWLPVLEKGTGRLVDVLHGMCPAS